MEGYVATVDKLVAAAITPRGPPPLPPRAGAANTARPGSSPAFKRRGSAAAPEGAAASHAQQPDP